MGQRKDTRFQTLRSFSRPHRWWQAPVSTALLWQSPRSGMLQDMGVPCSPTLSYWGLSISWAASSSGAPHRTKVFLWAGITPGAWTNLNLCLDSWSPGVHPACPLSPGAVAPPAVSQLREDLSESILTPSRNEASLSLPHPGGQPALAP